MQTIFTTADVPPDDAFDYWMDVVRTEIIKCSIATANRLRFQGDVRAGAVGDLPIVRWKAATEAAMIAHTDGGGDDLLLFCPCSRWHLEFSDRQSEINQRTLLLVNDRDKIISRTMEPVDQIALRIPRDVLEERIAITGMVTNQPIAAQGDAALLAGFIREIVHIGPSTLSPAVAMLVREQMLDLTAIALGNLAGVTPRLGATTRFVTLKLRAPIESKLTDPNVDRQSIAAAAGISERHADRLLARQGTSVRRLLIERRLAKCREAFEDQMQLGRSISDIAFAFGFRDLSHFNHAFKNRYGLAPREYRITFWSDGTLMSHRDKR